MELAALISFAALVVAWLVLPVSEPRVEALKERSPTTAVAAD